MADSPALPPPLPLGPLDGVKVLDLSEDIAGSFCARLLADYGADVLKLEPVGGSALRRAPPFFGDDPHPEKSLFFLLLNLNKKSANLNLENAAGRDLLKQLVPHVDVVVESFRPGYLDGLGVGYDGLEPLNPSLIMTSITPFGQTGPYSGYKGEEIVSYAMGMIMSISGSQEREPLKHGGFQAQYEGGLNGAAATAMALFMADNTGEGQHIDVSVTECVASTMMATQTMYPFMGGTQPRRRPTGSNFGHPMRCEDGWIIVQTGGGATWETIADFFGPPELREPRFAETGQRNQNGEELDRIVLDSIKGRGKWDLFTEAAQARMLFGLVQTPSELADCPQLESRELLPGSRPPGDRQDQGPGGVVQPEPDPLPLHRSGPYPGATQPRNLRGRPGLYPAGVGETPPDRRDIDCLNQDSQDFGIPRIGNCELC